MWGECNKSLELIKRLKYYIINYKLASCILKEKLDKYIIGENSPVGLGDNPY